MGVGKSTVGQLLANKLSLPFYPEPFEYNPGITMCLGSPLETQMIQLDLVHRQHQNCLGVFDTSPLSVLMYSRHFYKQGVIDAQSIIMLNHRANIVCVEPANVNLFLVATPQVICDRISKRNRDFETLNLNLITDTLSDCHYYANKLQSSHIVNCESDPTSIVNYILEIIND